MTRRRTRQWVLEIAYPDRPAWLFGTLEAESDEQLHQQFAEAWAKWSPHPRPNIIKAFPGMLICEAESA